MIDPERLRRAIEAANGEWIFESWGNQTEKYLQEIGRDIDEFINNYNKYFHEFPDPFRLLGENPTKGRAFFQFDSLRTTSSMKIVIWRIFLGLEFKSVEFRYTDDTETGSSLRITLKNPHDDQACEEYECDPPHDFPCLRHIGAMRRNGLLLLQGYYAPKR